MLRKMQTSMTIYDERYEMTKQLHIHKTVAFLVGLCLFIVYASVAYAHGSDPNVATGDVINMNLVAGGLGIAGYLLMVNEIPQKLLGTYKEK